MIKSIGKRNWASKRYIPADDIQGFNLVLKDGSNYPISRDEILIVTDGVGHTTEGSKAVESVKESPKKTGTKTEEPEVRPDEIQNND